MLQRVKALYHARNQVIGVLKLLIEVDLIFGNSNEQDQSAFV